MSPGEATEQPELIRGVGLTGATTLNMIDMIGVGPFITIPLIVSAAGGPQAMLGWIAGAVFALCDGLVWAELGAAMPNAGGSYQYLKEAYGPQLPWSPAVLSLHLAIVFQRTAFHRLRMHRPGALRRIHLARLGAHLVFTYFPRRNSAARFA